MSLFVAGGAYGQTPSVCMRTMQVQQAIVDAVSGVDNCANVISAHLAVITTLGLNGRGITQLSEGDFSGLANLQTLDLYNNSLQSLPADIFDGLTSLETLSLNNNQLQTLPADIFDDLTNLSDLNLENNPFSDGLPPALIEEAKEFVESGRELRLDIVAVNGALTTLNLSVNRAESVDLEDAFILFGQGTSSPAESYEITVIDDEAATVTEIIGHTLTVKALAEGQTEIEVAGIHGDQRATQRFTVIAELAANLIFRIKVFLEGAQ